MAGSVACPQRPTGRERGKLLAAASDLAPMPTRSHQTPVATPSPQAGAPVKTPRSKREASDASAGKKARPSARTPEPALPRSERQPVNHDATSRPHARKVREPRPVEREGQKKASVISAAATGESRGSSERHRDRMGKGRPTAGGPAASSAPKTASKAAAPKAAPAAKTALAAKAAPAAKTAPAAETAPAAKAARADKAPGHPLSDDRPIAAAPARPARVTRPSAPKTTVPPAPPARRRSSAASGTDRRRRSAVAPAAAPSTTAISDVASEAALPTELPHVVGLWRAAREARARANPDATGAQRPRLAAPAPVSIQVLAVAGRDLAPAPIGARLTRADFLPPAVVLGMQLAVGWVVGANPLVLVVGAATIIAVAYLVWSTSRNRRAAAMQASVAASLAAQAASNASGTGMPSMAPPSPVAVQSQATLEVQSPTEETPASPPAPATRPASDLRWLWGTILRDPTPRTSRRDRS